MSKKLFPVYKRNVYKRKQGSTKIKLNILGIYLGVLIFKFLIFK